MHCNFSTKYMREVGARTISKPSWLLLAKNWKEHIDVYGPDNHLRLTGKHETAPWNKFSYGVADRWRVDPRSAFLRQQRLQGLP